MLGGTLIPYHAERFGSTSHIAPSIPVVEVTSHIPLRYRVSDLIRIPDPRRVTIGSSMYIITQIPSSSVPSSSNVHPPPYSHGPSSQHMATSQVRTVVTRPIVSQVYIPLVASGGNVHTSRGHVTNFGPWGIACDDLWTLLLDAVWTRFFTLWRRVSITCLLS